MYVKINKKYWNKLCVDWHHRIWENLHFSDGEGKVYLKNAGIALKFLKEFTVYCDWSWKVEEFIEKMSEVVVDKCPNFDVKFMTDLVQQNLVETEGDFIGKVTLSGVFKYLNSEDQKNKYLASWFDDH